jgi:hypothetical protein
MAVYHRTQRLQIYGEKPEVTKLFGDRYRMVVRCKAARDTEAWYNANKDQIFASFGTLYSAQMSVDGIDPRVGEAYPDMCLVSNSASYTQTGEYVISFVYETLTAVWTKEQGDEVTSTDNGLRVLERSEVAKVDGFPIVQLSSPNSSKVVLSGMGNASNYFVLLVKANSANTIYWRATNEVLATYNGSFTTANTDQWEYKVIYTPISIDQLEIGYDGTNYSTFDLSEFYLVSQSSDWQNNIVESFIKFEVTVDNSSPFTDTVVFTGSNGNTATGTNVQGGGTGSISSPYDEDDVGVSTITNGGKTLYLASFQDQTGAESNAQVGRVVTRWAEAGTLNRSEDKVGSQQAITIQAIGEVPATPEGYSLARTSVGNYEGFQTNDYTFLKPSVLSRSIREQNNGALIIETVEAFDEIPTADTEGAVNIGEDVSNVEGIPTRRYTFAKGDGQIQVSKRPASPSLAGATEVTVVSYGTAVTPTGVLIAESETEEDGYVRYTKTALQGTITGVKQTYQDVVTVDVPGIVSCKTEASGAPTTTESSASGTVAVVDVQPRRTRRVTATVTVEIVSSAPASFTAAYDIGNISCSVTSKREILQYSPGQVIQTGFEFNDTVAAFNEFSQSYSLSANTQTYPGCYYDPAFQSSDGTVSYNSAGQWKYDPSTGWGLVLSTSETTTSCTASGSSSVTGYVETGVIQRKSRPILSTIGGGTYWEVITWTV